jgi:hypothetical protein
MNNTEMYRFALRKLTADQLKELYEYEIACVKAIEDEVRSRR